MKQDKNDRPKKESSFRPGTKAYSITLGICFFFSLYTLGMVLAVAPSNAEVAYGYLFSQSIVLILTLVLLFFQVRHWIRTGTGPNVMEKLKGIVHWLDNMLHPVRNSFAPITNPSLNAQKMTARFRDNLDDAYHKHRDLTQTTQLYGNLLELHAQRLKKMGLEVRCSYQAMSVKGLKDCAVSRIPDGRLNHFSVQEHLRADRQILCGSRKIHAIKGNVAAVCDFVGAAGGGAEAAGQTFRCPNCGAVSTAAELIKGCPYCGTAFLMENLKDRVCSFAISPSPEMDETYFHLRLDQFINRFAFGFSVIEFIFGVIPMMYEVFILNKAGLHELPFAVILFSFTMVLMFFGTIALNWVITLPIRAIAHRIYEKRRRDHSLDHQVMERNRRILPVVLGKDPEFSMESFFSNVRNKIAAIHYSNKYEQADVFSTADLKEAVEAYKDIVECVWGPMELVRYDVGAVVKTAVVDTWLTLLHWDGKGVFTTREKLRLTLKKNVKESRENPFGIHVPTCSKCLGSVDLLLGNKCPHCGSDLNFMNLDWCITGYEYQAVPADEKAGS